MEGFNSMNWTRDMLCWLMLMPVLGSHDSACNGWSHQAMHCIMEWVAGPSQLQSVCQCMVYLSFPSEDCGMMSASHWSDESLQHTSLQLILVLAVGMIRLSWWQDLIGQENECEDFFRCLKRKVDASNVCCAQENGLEDQFVLPLTRRFNQIWRLMVFVAGSQLHLVWLLLILVCLHLASPFMSKVAYPSSCSFFQRHQSERHSEGRVGDRMSPFRLEWGYDL